MNTARIHKKQNFYHPYGLLFMCVIIIFITACSNGFRRYVRPEFNTDDIKKVAVLPFENLSSDKYAAEKVRNMAVMDLLSRGIDVVEPGEVVKTLREMKVKAPHLITTDDIKRLGKVMDVSQIITGSVETFGISKGITVSYPEVTVSMRMHESATGDIVWSVWHTTGGASFGTRHFGAEGRTLDEASQEALREAFNTLF